MAACVSAVPSAPTHCSDRSVQVMRWTFKRDDEVLFCELGLNQDESAYEISMTPPWTAAGIAAELFDDAIAAFQRLGDIERVLVAEGWSLDNYESRRVVRVTAPARPATAR